MLKIVGLVCGFIAFSAVIGYTSAECIQCSSATENNCLFGENILPTNCTVLGHQCFTQIVEGETVRGCATEWSAERHATCVAADHCETCINLMGRPGCNNQIFPLNRARCHICSATGNTTLCANPQTAAPSLCPTFTANDRCFILRRGETFERGCVSSESVCADPANCFTCDGHGCNNVDVNTLVLPEAPGSAVINAISSSLMIVVALMVSAQFSDLL